MARRRSGHPKRKNAVKIVGAEFFKVFLPKFSSHQLLIPPDFFENFGRTIKEKVILKNIDGKTWYVDVKGTPNGVFLQNGWQEFVDYHGLKVGEFLVFRYEGSYTFMVKIFGTNGCKKETFESKIIAACVKSEEETDEETKPKQTSRKRGRTEHSDRFGEVNEVEEVDSPSNQKTARDPKLLVPLD
ncbi:hypothetical protein C2S52_004760 [Perilla frutescens var. hirtella]|nr:hypothetical protein C2S52_004760 [Perilla frutescens var. hirtella]